jgi:hypothetical protein
MNKEVPNQIVEILTEQIEIQEELALSCKMLTAAICSRKTDAIQSILLNIDTLTEKSDRLEASRVELIASCKDIPENRIRLTQILTFFSKDDQKRLIDCRDKLTILLKENRKVIISNNILLESALTNIHEMIMTIGGAYSKTIRYSAGGKGEQGVRKNLLNRIA